MMLLENIKLPRVMGILNVTPDSFSDGGCYLDVDSAYERARLMIADGADVIDVGGESSRPGSEPISVDEELQRVIPVIERIHASHDVCISIDTYKPEVMFAAVSAGATFINDIFALRSTGALAMAARLNVPVCLMHMQGVPHTMQESPCYVDIIDEINVFFQQRIDACIAAGISRDHLILDPGFGFGKSVQHNLLLTKRLMAFQQHQLPILFGVSRKSTIGAISKRPVHQRLPGGLALEIFGMLQGVSIIRTHAVAETYQALQMIDATLRA